MNETLLREGAPLHNEDHAHLIDADVAYLWAAVENVRQMRRVVGQCEEVMIRAGGWQRARQEQQLCEWFGRVLDAVQATNGKIDALAERVTKLEGGTATGDEDPDADPSDPTRDNDPDPDADPQAARTGDSTALRDEFQDALSRAEILAPGVRLPTFDAKAVRKKTVDAICVLRRRALRAAMDNENAEAVKAVTGGADISGMPCNAVQAFFNAASELVRGKNSGVLQRRTSDSAQAGRKDINEVHAEFWKNRK
ncbi:putative metallopeptidase [Burkholderia ubonensis]|uniref:putative metallopeptidase n=1 Tax=Burkholderia ubonensis TaxID=101571 RepID=UPI002FC7958F